MSKRFRLLSVDPGDNTAWAYWRNTFSPEVGQITLNKNECTGLYSQFQYMWNHFDLVLTSKKPNMCVIEGVEVYAGSLKSYVASKKTKFQDVPSLFKLAYLIGGYMNICDNHCVKFEIVSYRKWAAQLSETAIKVQVKHIMNKNYSTIHKYCAVGIGLNYLGKF